LLLTGTPVWLTSIALIIIGSIWFYQYFEPKEDEIILLAARHTKGFLTVAVSHELL
jgi:putative Mn2+ efflux pump MntP